MALKRAKAKRILKAACFDGLGQFFEMLAAANHEKNDARFVAQSFGGAQHRLKVMGAAQISGMADDKFVRQMPGLPERIVRSARPV
jgi:predicted TPR repeat methyltransferase